MLKQDVVIMRVAGAVAVLQDQIVVTKLSECCNDLLRYVRFLVNGQRKVQIVGLRKITELL